MDKKVGDLQKDLEALANDTRRDQKDASRKLDEAAGSIRDKRVREKIRYSKSQLGGSPSDYAKAMEDDIAANLDALQKKIGEAESALGNQSKKDALGRVPPPTRCERSRARPAVAWRAHEAATAAAGAQRPRATAGAAARTTAGPARSAVQAGPTGPAARPTGSARTKRPAGSGSAGPRSGTARPAGAERPAGSTRPTGPAGSGPRPRPRAGTRPAGSARQWRPGRRRQSGRSVRWRV